MKSATAKLLILGAFLFFCAACENGTAPLGQMYTSGVYKFIGGEVHIPETDNHTAAGVLITRFSDSKIQTAYAVPDITMVTVTSSQPTGARSFAEPQGNPNEPVAENIAAPYANRYYSPSQYLPQIEDALKLREDELTRKSGRAAVYPRNIFNVGDTWYGVNIYHEENGIYTKTDAKCIGVSDHAYFMQDVKTTDLDANLLALYMEDFDKNYEIMHDYFAKEADTDGNGKVIVMLHDLGDENLVGLFHPKDKIETAAKSNLADMFYINISVASENKDARLTSGTLVHELQHMIYFDNIKTPSSMYVASTWFNEAMSMLAMYVCGYYEDGTDNYISNFRTSYPSLSLTNWTDNNYGFSLLFGVYFYEHFGKTAVNALYNLSVAGIPAIEAVTWRDFNDIYMDFATALAISKRGYTNEPRYNFSGIDFRRYAGGKEYNLQPTQTVAAGNGYTVDMQYYGLVSTVFTGRTKSVNIGTLFDGRIFLKR